MPTSSNRMAYRKHKYCLTRLLLSSYKLMAAGFHPHLAGAWHRYGAKALGASMWFWMMYRAKQDMPVLLVCINMKMS